MKTAMKKHYEKPSMKVYALQQPSRLLTTSGDQWLNYAPSTPEDMNKLT